MPIQLKIDAIIPTDTPLRKLDQLEKAITNELERGIKPTLKRDLQATTQSWRHKPYFVGLVYVSPSKDPTLIVYPKGEYRERWIRISRGVRGRVISAKRAKYLRFRHYRPHTTASGGLGGPGEYYGPPILGYTKVNWKGIKPRLFEDKIMEKRRIQIIGAIGTVVLKVLAK